MPSCLLENLVIWEKKKNRIESPHYCEIEMIAGNHGIKESPRELTFVWAQHYHLKHPPWLHTHTHTPPPDPTLHHMRCQKRIKRWWNSFMCCIRHRAFDQIPFPHLVSLPPAASLLFPSWCGEEMCLLEKWNRTNKWDWVCWPHFVIPHKTRLPMRGTVCSSRYTHTE